MAMYGSQGGQSFNDSQRQRLRAPQERLKARSGALKALFGESPELADGTTGASPTEDPIGAEADLQQELQNEQQQRARAKAVKNLYGFGG